MSEPVPMASGADAGSAASPPQSLLQGLVRTARPKQWMKNVLAFAAPGAAGFLDNGHYLVKAVLTFVALCLASSGTYYWNDILDVEADRVHATKRFRPIASGTLPLGRARVIGTVLLLGGPALAFATRWQAGLACVVYVVLTTSYSAIWKHIAVVDLIAVASGFVLRAVAGAAATNVPMSSWFVMCITFGSLFIVTGKRYAELREAGDGPSATRATLDDYSLGFLRMVLSVSCGATLVSYCIWAFEVKKNTGSTLPFYQLSIVPRMSR